MSLFFAVFEDKTHRLYHFHVAPRDTVFRIRNKLSKSITCEPDSLTLTYNGQQIRENETYHDLGYERGKPIKADYSTTTTDDFESKVSHLIANGVPEKLARAGLKQAKGDADKVMLLWIENQIIL